ncbi:nucleoside transporter 1 [Trypanosoma grayi]|uniref:nucleoside transporter 1 n=1 Tax=Trypanosoma grayi TaxID=71804 RepID=UPI0004F40EF1|nr:nucleoside transporter 1 [Trypanosoma grayi]KEG06901.1 nucleoside transporter 1 [Trypanosoma grayi]
MFGFESGSEFMAYITFMFFGLSVMVATNSILAAPSFFTEYYRYAQGDSEIEANDPSFWDNVLTFYNVVTFATQFFGEAFMLTPLGRSIPLRPRLIVGFVIPFVEFLVLIFVPVAGTSEAGAKATVLVMAFVGGISVTLCESSTNALAGPFPTKFFGAVMMGIGFSGVLFSLMQIIIKASMADDFDSVLTQSRIFFGVAMGMQLISCVLLVFMPRNEFARRFTAEFRYGHEVAAENQDALEDNEKEAAAEEHEADAQCMEPVLPKNTNVLTAEGDADDMKDVDQVDNITSTEQMLNAQVGTVFVRIWPILLSCFAVFGASLLVYPGVFFAVDVHDGWYLTTVAAMFNLGDFVSRFSLQFKRFHPSPRVVVIGTVARWLVIPPLILCVRHIIPGKVVPCILCLIWGLTNGYFGGMSMIYCPRTPSLTTAGQRSLAGIMAAVALLLGLFVGSSLALAVKEGFPDDSDS